MRTWGLLSPASKTCLPSLVRGPVPSSPTCVAVVPPEGSSPPSPLVPCSLASARPSAPVGASQTLRETGQGAEVMPEPANERLWIVGSPGSLGGAAGRKQVTDARGCHLFLPQRPGSPPTCSSAHPCRDFQQAHGGQTQGGERHADGDTGTLPVGTGCCHQSLSGRHSVQESRAPPGDARGWPSGPSHAGV